MRTPSLPASPSSQTPVNAQPASPGNGYSLGELPAFPRAQVAVDSALAAMPPRRGMFSFIRRTNPFARAAQLGAAAAQLEESLARATRENWTPEEIRYVARAAIVVRNELAKNESLPAFERAMHLQWCVETYDEHGLHEPGNAFMGDIARRACDLFFISYGRESTLARFRALQMDARALEFGAPGMGASHQALVDAMANDLGLHHHLLAAARLPLSPRETASVEAGRFPWPEPGDRSFKISPLAGAAGTLDDFLARLDEPQPNHTMTSRCQGLINVIAAIGSSPDLDNRQYFTDALHNKLARRLKAIESAHADGQTREFARMALDLYFPEGRPQPSVALAQAVARESEGDVLSDWGLKRGILVKLFRQAERKGIPDAAETRLQVLGIFDMRLADHGVILDKPARPLEELLTLRNEARAKTAKAGIHDVLPAALADLTQGWQDDEVDPKAFKEQLALDGSQVRSDNRAINHFVAQVKDCLATDYAQGNMLRLYGRLFLSFRDNPHAPDNMKLKLHLAEEIAKQRDWHSDPAMQALLDEMLALFSPELAKNPTHDLPAVLQKAADGFIEVALVVPAEQRREEPIRLRFIESWQVLFDRLNNGRLTNRDGLRAILHTKLMAFANKYPHRTEWVREVLRYSGAEINDPNLAELWRLETPARLMRHARAAIAFALAPVKDEFGEPMSPTEKMERYRAAWSEIRVELDKSDLEESARNDLRQDLLVTLVTFDEDDPEQASFAREARSLLPQPRSASSSSPSAT